METKIKVAKYGHKDSEGVEELVLVCDACFEDYRAKHKLHCFRGYLSVSEGRCACCGRKSW